MADDVTYEILSTLCFACTRLSTDDAALPSAIAKHGAVGPIRHGEDVRWQALADFEICISARDL